MGIPFGCYQCRGFNPTCSKCGGSAFRLRDARLAKFIRSAWNDGDPWIDCPCPGTKGCEKCEQVTPQD